MDFSGNLLLYNLPFYFITGATLVSPLLFAVSVLVCAVRGWKKNRSRTAGILISVVAAYLIVGFCIIAILYALDVFHRPGAWPWAFIWPVTLGALVLGWGN